MLSFTLTLCVILGVGLGEIGPQVDCIEVNTVYNPVTSENRFTQTVFYRLCDRNRDASNTDVVHFIQEQPALVTASGVLFQNGLIVRGRTIVTESIIDYETEDSCVWPRSERRGLYPRRLPRPTDIPKYFYISE